MVTPYIVNQKLSSHSNVIASLQNLVNHSGEKVNIFQTFITTILIYAVPTAIQNSADANSESN